MNERIKRAISAANTIANGRGEVADPVVLADSNHVIVRFGDIVAKIAPQPASCGLPSALERDVTVASWLARRGCAVVEPADDPGPHRVADVELTLWRYCPHDAEAMASDEDAARALRQLHADLASYDGYLPSFTTAIDDAGRLLAGSRALVLSVEERHFLLRVHERASVNLDSVRRGEVLHGDVHSHQLLVTPNGFRWHDFECASRGPYEWDLAGLEETRAYGNFDADLLATLRTLRQVCVVAWCAVAPHRSGQLRDALDYHLADLRRREQQSFTS